MAEEQEERQRAEALDAERQACAAALLQGAEVMANDLPLAVCSIEQLNSIQVWLAQHHNLAPCHNHTG